MLIKIIQNLLDLLFPKSCLNCGKGANFLCKQCFSNLELLKKQICFNCRKNKFLGSFCSEFCNEKFYFDQLIACTEYKKNSLIKKLLANLKYKFCEDTAEILSEVLFKQFSYYYALMPEIKNAVIIPVPIHKKRLKYRGFNQVEILSSLLYKKIVQEKPGYIKNFKFIDCLERTSFNKAQMELKREERLSNLRNAIKIKDKMKQELNGKFIFLIDDVITTGATLNECSRILKENGVKMVCSFVLCKAI